MRRGTVLLLRRGDPEISGAIAEGMLAARAEVPMPTDEIGMVAAEIDRQHILRALREDMRRLDMMRHSPEELEAMIMKARFDYGQTRPTPRWVARLLGLYGLLCLGIARAYRAQDRVLGRD